MINATVKVVENRLPYLSGLMAQRASAAVRKTTFDIERISKQSMQGPKTGRMYPRTGGNWHQASAAGEAPAIDTGALVNSIMSEFPSSVTGIVSTNMEYAPHLEYGTTRMAPRPFFTPAAERAFPGFQKAMEQIFK